MERSKLEALEWAIEEAANAIGGRDPDDYAELESMVLQAREALRELKMSSSVADKLSPQERAVFRRIAAGFSPAQMADDLKLSVKTVSTYRARIMQKLGLGSNAEMAILAFELGLAPSILKKGDIDVTEPSTTEIGDAMDSVESGKGT